MSTNNSSKQTPTSLSKAFEDALENRSARQLRRKLTISPPNSHDFSSNDFLSLSRSPAFRARFLAHLQHDQQTAPADEHQLQQYHHPQHPQGLASGGSRLLDGNSAFAEDLERTIASFHRAESALLFNSGYDANVGLLSCVPQLGDAIVYDALAHASIHDGMRLSRASASACLPFPHNAPEGLRGVLKELVSRWDRERRAKSNVGGKGSSRNIFVVVESVYSMDGDVAPVDRFCDVIDEVLPHGNGYLIIDEAHATGIFGPRGAGVVQKLGQQQRVFIRVHTFGKALASHGAAVLCSSQTRDYLINYARSLIYTTALPFPALASIRTAYEFLDSDECDELRSKLHRLIAYCHNSLMSIENSDGLSSRKLCLPRGSGNLLRVVTIKHEPSSPIFSVLTPFALDLAATCRGRGFVVSAVRPPTVPAGTERVRVCLHSGNTVEAIDQFTAVVRSWVRGTDRFVATL
ncbi:aminotransferase [Pseudomassariella vexata]|uniref:Aminotransferase n=1 Tax=Pseudomassariella vexata TaxID=1141098 RepID=A0A1Y2EC16_9PEZI|nr:aminotransferase [Pseudomassariella vexata]ORY69119.1 aminotransferase [Pseudomassariella vexata]